MILVDYGFMGTIMNVWIKHVTAANPSLLDHASLKGRNTALKAVFISIVYALLGFLTKLRTQTVVGSKKDFNHGVKTGKEKRAQHGKGTKLDIGVYTVGWNGNLEHLGYANSAELNQLRNTTGLIRVEPTKEIYPTGKDCAQNATADTITRNLV